MLNISTCTVTITRPVGSTNADTTILTAVRATLTNASDSQKLSQIALGLPGITQANIQELWRLVVGGYDENPLPAGWVIQVHDKVAATGDASNPELTGKYEVFSQGVFSPLLPICKAWVIKKGS